MEDWLKVEWHMVQIVNQRVVHLHQQFSESGLGPEMLSDFDLSDSAELHSWYHSEFVFIETMHGAGLWNIDKTD